MGCQAIRGRSLPATTAQLRPPVASTGAIAPGITGYDPRASAFRGGMSAGSLEAGGRLRLARQQNMPKVQGLVATGLEPATSGVTGHAGGATILHGTTRKTWIAGTSATKGRYPLRVHTAVPRPSRPIYAPSRRWLLREEPVRCFTVGVPRRADQPRERLARRRRDHAKSWRRTRRRLAERPARGPPLSPLMAQEPGVDVVSG